MISLYVFGSAFGMPDPSPFVMKAEVLLKIAGLPYKTDPNGFNKAPKGKLPYIEDAGEIVADSTIIRWHLERKYALDLDAAIAPAERAVAWAFEKMIEDNLYWVILGDRWTNDANFAKGPANFFKRVPMPLRPVITRVVRRQVRQSIKAQGLGRHSAEDAHRLGIRSIDAIAEFLGTKPYFMGPSVCGVDATVFAFVAHALCPVFDSPIRTAAQRHDNLKRYVGRMTARYYPQLDEIAGCKALS
ncbi:MAG: glutathione S-transferase N-terminal domain-containing protein [Proteobacteria bacterium]|nr:glutathione S-transferase N-terminal domain-containing protein [Pseudomonadota bacterium]